jgi:hypothetical protein
MDDAELRIRLLTYEYALRGLAAMHRDMMLKAGLKMNWVKVLDDIKAQAAELDKPLGNNVVPLRGLEDSALAEAMHRAHELLSNPEGRKP